MLFIFSRFDKYMILLFAHPCVSAFANVFAMRARAQWRRDRQIDSLLDADRAVCLPATQDFIARVYPHAFHGAAIGNRTVRAKMHQSKTRGLYFIIHARERLASTE